VLHFNTCAIVANGGIMLNALEGAEIDAHDAVFRINYAPVLGPSATGHDLAAHVGRKTTMDFVNTPNSRMLLHGQHHWRKALSKKHKDPKAARDPDSLPPTLALCESPDRDSRREVYLPLMMRNPDKELLMINPEMLYT